MTQALKRLKATAAVKPKKVVAAKPKLDPKDQKAFDAALAKAFKARDAELKKIDKSVADFKKQYASDEVLKSILLADFDGSGSLSDALGDLLDEIKEFSGMTFPEFLEGA